MGVANTLNFDLGFGHFLEFVTLLISADFVNCHCTGRWAVFDKTHRKDSVAFD